VRCRRAFAEAGIDLRELLGGSSSRLREAIG